MAIALRTEHNFQSGWAVIPFYGEKAHFWKPAIPHTTTTQRIDNFIALCGYQGVSGDINRPLDDVKDWPKCKKCLKRVS